MRIKADSYFAIFLLLLSVVVIILAFTTMKNRIESMAIPIAMGSIILILAAWQLVTEINEGRKEQTKTAAGEESKPRDREKTRRLITTVAWIVGGALGIFLLGFYIGITLLVLLYLRVNKRKWLISVAVSAINTALTYLIFEFWLGTALYLGLIYDWISKLLGY